MRLYLRALSYFRADLPLIVLWVLLIGLSTAVGLLAAWPMAVLIDSVLTPAHGAARPDWVHRLLLGPLPSSPVGRIVGLAVAGLLIKLLQDWIGAAQTIISNQVNYNGLMRVRCDLYRKVQALSVAYHRAQPQGDTICRLTSDTFGCQTILGVFISTFVATVTLGVMSCVLCSRSATLTILAFSILPPLAVVNVVFGRRLKRKSVECKERDSRLTTVVQRTVSCIGLVQAFGREPDELTRFRGSVRETISAWWGLNREQLAYNLIVGCLFGTGGAAIFGYGGYLVYRGTLTLGDLTVFTSYLGMVWGPLCSLTGFASNVQGGVAGAERVFEVLDRDPVIADAPGAVALPCRPRVLELENVGFTYRPIDEEGDGDCDGSSDSGKPVLDGLSVRIEPGQMVAFVGSSGVGKSTLLNLLPRFYDPAEGTVRLDGLDARTVRLKDLRRHVALVLQESAILPATIAENIAYGRPHATREQIRTAARLASAAEFIEQLPQGYDTFISEGGQNLSGGQRQRIAIARALLTEAPFVVLDEPTSALDPVHERLITETLRGLKRQRTIVLVSHRLSTVVDCDRIFVMDAGRVVEQGTHEQLVRLRGLYYEMARHQLGLDDSPGDTADKGFARAA